MDATDRILAARNVSRHLSDALRRLEGLGQHSDLTPGMLADLAAAAEDAREVLDDLVAGDAE